MAATIWRHIYQLNLFVLLFLLFYLSPFHISLMRTIALYWSGAWNFGFLLFSLLGICWRTMPAARTSKIQNPDLFNNYLHLHFHYAACSWLAEDLWQWTLANSGEFWLLWFSYQLHLNWELSCQTSLLNETEMKLVCTGGCCGVAALCGTCCMPHVERNIMASLRAVLKEPLATA